MDPSWDRVGYNSTFLVVNEKPSETHVFQVSNRETSLKSFTHIEGLPPQKISKAWIYIAKSIVVYKTPWVFVHLKTHKI